MKKLKAVSGKVNRRKVKAVSQDRIDEGVWEDFEGGVIDSQHLILSLLIPPAVKEFMAQLNAEVATLCGPRHSQGEDNQRWGRQAGSIILANQKVRVEKPRVRGRKSKKEVPLPFYETFQSPEIFDEKVFADGLRKVSQRDYEKGVSKIGASFGFTKSSVSRTWVKTTQKTLEELNSRRFEHLGLVAVMLDGKKFRDRGVIVGMGVDKDGKKHVLGIYECDSEKAAACEELLISLEARGMPDSELLFVVDGGKGLNKALENRYKVHLPNKRKAVRVRCFIHKWRNIEGSLDKETAAQAAGLYWGIRDANKQDIAESCAEKLQQLLKGANESAWRSFLEARDDLLMISRLNLSPNLRKFFSTTNALESLNYLTEEDLRRVKQWKNSNHFQRWLAASCLQAEKRMRRVRGYKGIPALQAALGKLCFQDAEENKVDTVSRTGT